MLLLRPDLEDDKLQSAVERVTRAIVNAGGSLSKVSPWGKRRLAYEISHFREASYFLIHFDIEPAQVRGIERGLLISEEILRHLVTVIEDRGAVREEEIPAAVPAAVREEDDDLLDELDTDEEEEEEEDEDEGEEADTAAVADEEPELEAVEPEPERTRA
jgi:small subunit ribosomal protein S6